MFMLERTVLFAGDEMKRMITSIGLLLAILVAVTPLPAWAQTIQYYHTDAIGNVRVVTNSSGAVIERHDYLPFGEECMTGPCAANPGVGGGQPKKFTGKERDAETGLDYFGARYNESGVGRFTSVDPVQTLASNISDPQRWNRYAYARSNPLRYTDPDGKVIFDYAQFKENLGLVGTPGVGYDIKALAVLATAGSVANDILLVTGIGELAQGARAGLTALAGRTGARVASGAGGEVGEMAVVRTIGRGEKIADIVEQAKTLTYESGREHALVKLANGERALVSGGEGGISFGEGQVSRIYGHTHPTHLPTGGPSAADIQSLGTLGQRSSYLYERGQLTKFTVGVD